MIQKSVFLFICLFILTFPFEQALLPNFPSYYASLFENLSKWTAVSIFGWSENLNYKLQSDSSGLYVHTFHLIILSVSVVFLWNLFDKKNKYNLIQINSLIASYYLSLQLFNYGFSKIFHVQFFFPEPNTLLTPLGHIDKDLLFWSSMGSSYVYSFFCGIIELVPAVLLVFRKSRFLGAVISTAVMTNVLMINIGFDISVKLLSSFLLFLSVIILIPPLSLILKSFKNNLPLDKLNSTGRELTLSTLLLFFLSLNGLFPYLKSNGLSENVSEHTQVFGAYEVENFVVNGDTLAPLTTDRNRWRRIFIHRRSYFIVQNMQDKMYDYELESNHDNKVFILTDYRKNKKSYYLKSVFKKDRLILSGNLDSNEILIEAIKLDLSNLPLLKKTFHWSVN